MADIPEECINYFSSQLLLGRGILILVTISASKIATVVGHKKQLHLIVITGVDEIEILASIQLRFLFFIHKVPFLYKAFTKVIRSHVSIKKIMNHMPFLWIQNIGTAAKQIN